MTQRDEIADDELQKDLYLQVDPYWDLSPAERRLCFPDDGDDEANGVQLRSAVNTRQKREEGR